MSAYVTKLGVPLERKPDMFYWRGRWFHGLVDGRDLYDDPDDSFAAFVGIPSFARARADSNVMEDRLSKNHSAR